MYSNRSPAHLGYSLSGNVPERTLFQNLVQGAVFFHLVIALRRPVAQGLAFVVCFAERQRIFGFR